MNIAVFNQLFVNAVIFCFFPVILVQSCQLIYIGAVEDIKVQNPLVLRNLIIRVTLRLFLHIFLKGKRRIRTETRKNVSSRIVRISGGVKLIPKGLKLS